MGLLDDLIAGAMQSALKQVDTATLGPLLGQLLGKTDLGSLGGLLAALKAGGLDRQVGSWLGQGSNMEITPDQLRQAIGDEKASQIAVVSGITLEDLMAILAGHLPQTIDRMSPNGRLEEPQIDEGGGNPLEQILRRRGPGGSPGGGSLAGKAGLDDI